VMIRAHRERATGDPHDVGRRRCGGLRIRRHDTDRRRARFV
jgi:hypothetical protein